MTPENKGHTVGQIIDLRNGDSLQILKSLPDNSVGAVITDPPYG